jgi:hypothetical protein
MSDHQDLPCDYYDPYVCMTCIKKYEKNSHYLSLCELCSNDTCKKCMLYLIDIWYDNDLFVCPDCYCNEVKDTQYTFCIRCNCAIIVFVGNENNNENNNALKCKKCIRHDNLNKRIRLLWIGVLKNKDNIDCHFRNLPKDVLKYIIFTFLLDDNM